MCESQINRLSSLYAGNDLLWEYLDYYGQERVHQKRNQGSPHPRTPQQQQTSRAVFTPRSSTINTPSDPSSAELRSTSPPQRSTKVLNANKEVTMLAKATKALQEHVKDMTEKTRTTCCVGKPSIGMKENVLIQNQINIADPAHYIRDKINGNTYVRGKLLGKGGFAKCYELKCVQTGKIYAGKIISKSRLTKPHQRVKIKREVELHRPLKNSSVVQFHSYFEDDENVYFVLEICSRKSLVHVLRNRKTLTEPEVRYYMKELVHGLKYIHDQKIIHRDLKLGNMLLNDHMHVKLADFGLATRVEYEGEKKMTVCGTPNYIAPEVLQKKGHSYEADVWAMGCIMYAMLVGRPPFETTTLKETYSRITTNKYSVPPHVSLPAKSLIQKLLTPEPLHRPTLDEILEHEFFSIGYTPKTLSSACCETMPKFTYTGSSSSNRPKSYASPVSTGEAMFKIQSSIAMLKSPKTRSVSSAPQTITKSSGDLSPSRGSSSVLSSSSGRGSVRSAISPVTSSKSEPNVRHTGEPETETAALPVGSAIRLYQMLATCMKQMPSDSNPAPVHGVQPLWVTKWVDYSNKYGFGFQLSDKSVGVLFNDTTRMLLSCDGTTIQYNDLSNKIYTFSSDDIPRQYNKKSTLLLYFAHYMNEHLIHGGDILQHEQGPKNLPPPVFMKKWFRTGKAIVMYLNNGTLQVNFFEDHTKVILSPEGQDYLVTFINTHRQAVTYRLLQLRHFGCHPNIAQRLDYARTMMDSIINISGEAV